jgi:hypothetical protein
MRTRTLFLASLSLLAIAGLGLTTQASIAKSSPGITQTAQWKALKAYVNSLEAKKSTPATPAQKASFRSRLNTKQQATNERVKQLYAQNVNALKARDAAKERAAIKKVRQSQARSVADIKASLASRLAVARATYSRAVNKVNDNFSFRIASEKKNLKKLRRNLARTTDPIQRQLILTKIDTVKRELAQNRKIRATELDQASSYYQTQVRAITLRYDNKIIDTRAYYKALVRKVKSSWQVIYDDDLAAAKSSRTKQFSFVSKLKARGTGYIDMMPPAPI